MTYSGNFNINSANTVSIPTVNTSMRDLATPSTLTYLSGIQTSSLYYDSNKIYYIEGFTDVIYESNKTDPSNFRKLKSNQVGGQSEFLGNVYEHPIGDYYYAYGTNDDLGGAASGSVYRAHVNNPTSWRDSLFTLDASWSTNSHMFLDTNSQILLLGGREGFTPSNKIIVVSSSDGTDFSLSGNTLPAARMAGAIAIGGDNYYYMYGGTADGSNSESTIFRASTSSPTVWANSGSTLPRPIMGAIPYNDGTYIYLFGGYDSTMALDLDTIYRASVSTPTSFTSVGTLPAPTGWGKIVVCGSDLYMFGGQVGSGSGVFKASASDPTTWTVVSPAIKTAIRSSHVLVDKPTNKVYLIGGINSGGTTSTVIQSAPLNKPSEWTNEVSTLPTAVARGNLVKTSEYYYIIGGDLTFDLRASRSTPTTWVAANNGPGKIGGQVAFISGHIFHFGGENGSATPSSTVARAVVNNGVIQNWKTVGGSPYMSMALPIPLSRFQLIQAGDYLYVLGGFTTGPTMNTTVYRCQRDRLVGSSGFTTWVSMGTITNAMVEASVAVLNNRVYIIGGGPNTSFNTSSTYVLSASMSELAAGRVSFVEETASTVQKAGQSCTCINDILYLFGGRLTTTAGTSITRNDGSSRHNLILPKVSESEETLPTVDTVTGSLGTYSSFQRTGFLPWRVLK